ncbi:D-Ala-D-Ala carboxypeptidase family metallohydrolase [Paraburkholderia sp. J10-1]|uniref:D-Ala-D-Ala carboxypeptidase family metallohydrolase n=1 Tax=Paraburkholderia sp. J10-1 TaxID=2805430 RepID=UPI002AB68232|nr:D-Ala-D-Ala carboxypeptidase family metallohydrolase [Paraburkholderia sp. J10-1]
MTAEAKLSKNFALSEFIISQTAARKSIDNTPTPDIVANLTLLANALEDVRVLLGNRPILISSGYRCPVLNRAVGGALSSAHVQGLAADLTCPGYGTPLAICRALAGSKIPYDQIIFESTWAHFAIAAPGKLPRRQVLTAHFGFGVTTYSIGL